jgi:hypothetical protein
MLPVGLPSSRAAQGKDYANRFFFGIAILRELGKESLQSAWKASRFLGNYAKHEVKRLWRSPVRRSEAAWATSLRF